LKPGVSQEQALAELRVLQEQFRKANPADPESDPAIFPVVTSLQDSIVSNIRSSLLILSIAVGMVLLIACANVAGLLLTRSLGRRKEIAVPTALGARRSMVIRQLLTESILLALLAGMLGLGLSFAATRSLASLAAGNLPQGVAITMDARVLIFSLVISLLTGIAFGIFPALQLSRTDMNSTLRDEGRGSTGGHRPARPQNSLVLRPVPPTLPFL